MLAFLQLKEFLYIVTQYVYDSYVFGSEMRSKLRKELAARDQIQVNFAYLMLLLIDLLTSVGTSTVNVNSMLKVNVWV